MNLPNEFKRLAMEFEKAVQGQQKELIVRYRKALEEARNLLRKQFDRYEKDGKLSGKCCQLWISCFLSCMRIISSKPRIFLCKWE